jgi:hypothetical protein
MSREDYFPRIVAALAQFEREMTFAGFRPEEWGLTLTHNGYDRMLSLTLATDPASPIGTRPTLTGVPVTVVRELGR